MVLTERNSLVEVGHFLDSLKLILGHTQPLTLRKMHEIGGEAAKGLVICLHFCSMYQLGNLHKNIDMEVSFLIKEGNKSW